MLLLAVAFGIGVYMGDKGETKPTVPPWPQPVPRKTPTALTLNVMMPTAYQLSYDPLHG